MSTTHTPGPWKIYNKSIMSESGRVIFKTTNNNREPNLTFSDALRIVDCVNAMEGIDNPKNLRETWDAVQHLELDKYHKLKEVIQNMVDRLDEGSEMTLTKDSIIVHCLKEAIK